MQRFNSVMCGNFCIAFIDFMLEGKSVSDYTNLSSPKEYGKIDKIILKHFLHILKSLK